VPPKQRQACASDTKSSSAATQKTSTLLYNTYLLTYLPTYLPTYLLVHTNSVFFFLFFSYRDFCEI
jgi:hypothetical protein